MRLSAERLTAARLLIRVEEGAFSTRLLGGGTPLAARVRVLETLRWMRALDAVLGPLCRRPLTELDPGVRAALRLGLVEIVRLELPPGLATDGAVHLVKRLGLSSAAGMVNAVLRKAAVGWRGRLEVAAADVRLSHPWWVASRWSERFGRAAAEASMAAAQEPAMTWVWFFGDDARRAAVDAGLRLEPHPWCPGAWSAPEDAARLVPFVIEGSAYAQDPSSQLVAHVARALAPSGARALDLCAAPGGKAALLAALGGWSVLAAGDRALGRVRLMAPLLRRVGGVAAAAADALTPPFAAAAWELVLLDAPCTGTGTFRRHPELKWRLRPGAPAELAATQRRLLASAAGLVARGGTLLYATCSVEEEENEAVVASLPPGFEALDIEGALPPGTPALRTAAGGARILPNRDGDGFTMHALRRSEDVPR